MSSEERATFLIGSLALEGIVQLWEEVGPILNFMRVLDGSRYTNLDIIYRVRSKKFFKENSKKKSEKTKKKKKNFFNKNFKV